MSDTTQTIVYHTTSGSQFVYRYQAGDEMKILDSIVIQAERGELTWADAAAVASQVGRKMHPVTTVNL